MSRFTLVPAVHLFLVKGDQILLSRRFQTGYEDGKYSLPAGHLDGQESVTSAMIREAREEIGLELVPEQLQFAHLIHRLSDREQVDFFMVCTDWEGSPEIREPEKCDQLRWVPLAELPANTIPYIRHAIVAWQKGQPFSEFGWPTA